MWPITVDAWVTIRIKLISYSYINKGNQKETKKLKLLKTAQWQAQRRHFCSVAPGRDCSPGSYVINAVKNWRPIVKLTKRLNTALPLLYITLKYH